MQNQSKSEGFFPTTQWTQVGRVRSEEPEVRRQALGRILSGYLPAFRAYLERRRRMPPQQAEDAIQSFICDLLLDKDLLRHADQSRGRLRDLLRVALDRYVCRLMRRDLAGTRKPQGTIGSIDDAQPTAPEDADTFNRAWATEVIQRSIERVRHLCSREQKEQIFMVFELCTLNPLLHGIEPPPHREVMVQARLGRVQEVSNRLVTAKRMFARALREVIGEYAGEGADVDDELKSLMAVLAQRSARRAACANEEGQDELSI